MGGGGGRDMDGLPLPGSVRSLRGRGGHQGGSRAPGIPVLPARSPNTEIVREGVCSTASLVTALKQSVQKRHLNVSDASWKP